MFVALLWPPNATVIQLTEGTTGSGVILGREESCMKLEAECPHLRPRFLGCFESSVTPRTTRFAARDTALTTSITWVGKALTGHRSGL
jgi:hypothetical protein